MAKKRDRIVFKRHCVGYWDWQWLTPDLFSAFGVKESKSKKIAIADARKFADKFKIPPDVVVEEE